MTVERLNVYSGPYLLSSLDGGTPGQTVFPFDFQAASIGEVGVILDNMIVSKSAYIVSMLDDGTGSVTFLSAPTGARLFVYSDPLFSQEVNFEDQGPFYQSSVNEPIDRSAMRDLVLLEKFDRTLMTKFGDKPSNHPLQYPYVDANGNLAWADLTQDLTGGVVTIALLGAATGAGLVGWKRDSPWGAVNRTVAQELSRTVTPQQFGAIGDGTLHPLSERFATLSAAQAFYPTYPDGRPHHLTSLDQPIDFAALQAAYWVVENGGHLHLGRSHYRIGDNTIKETNYFSVGGDTRAGDTHVNDDIRFGAIIEGAIPGTVPLFTCNNPANVTFIHRHDVTFRGGSYYWYLGDEVASVTGQVWDRVCTEAQTISIIEINRLEVSTFRDCFMFSASRTGWGLHVRGFPNNNNRSVGTRWDGAGQGWLRFQGGFENWVCDGGSCEAGGQAGESTIWFQGNVVAGRGASFNGVYFEETGEYLLRCNNANGIRFGGACEFTGTSAGNGGMGLTAYKFHPDVDASATVVHFDDNRWGEDKHGVLTIPPFRSLITGINNGFDTQKVCAYSHISRNAGEFVGRTRNFSTGSVTDVLCTVLRGSTSSAATNHQTMELEVVSTLSGRLTGGAVVNRTKRWGITICAGPGGNFTYSVQEIGGGPTAAEETDNGSTLTLAIDIQTAPTSLDIRLLLGGVGNAPVAPHFHHSRIKYKVQSAVSTDTLALVPA